MKIQEFLFREALAEIGIAGGQVDIDHHQGLCFHAEVGSVPITFPMRIVNRVSQMAKEKTQNYHFMGVITPQRKWILKYPNVFVSHYGRNPQSKYVFHADYYAALCRTRFGIAPTGECPWSYRFLESVMCHAIPVLSDTEVDIFAPAFFHYRDSDTKVYDLEKCAENYRIFLQRHTFSHRLASFPNT